MCSADYDVRKINTDRRSISLSSCIRRDETLLFLNSTLVRYRD